MSDVAIRVENLSKQYRIGQRERYKTLRDSLTEAMYAPLRGLSSFMRRSSSGANQGAANEGWIWALKDVSFEVKHGEVIGIIGRNGAGKSTMLKILSRITEPTEGYAEIHGRVGSLLEVGTGFHPELTGRENIYLNGAVLGMKRREIERKFDEIVAFAEIEKFLDTPMKHYSSGMYVRLAFAVAAHLEPEILLVDEVLAVGDVAFQNKCLGKMGDVVRQGRTVLFVSHNMGAITQICPKTIWLAVGKIESIDKSDILVRRYLSESTLETPDVRIDPEANPHSPMVLTRCWIADNDGKPIAVVDVTQGFSIGLEALVRRQIRDADIAVNVHNGLGQPLFSLVLSNAANGDPNLTPGKHAFLIRIPGNFLAPDVYSFTVALHRPGVEGFDIRKHILSFRVEESGSNMWQFHGQNYGNILVQFPWQRVDGS